MISLNSPESGLEWFLGCLFMPPQQFQPNVPRHLDKVATCRQATVPATVHTCDFDTKQDPTENK